MKYLQEHGIPVFSFPENAAKAFGALYRYARWLNRQHLAQFDFNHDIEQAGKIIDDCIKQGRLQLGELDGLDLLKCYGFNVLPTHLATTESEAVQIANDMGLPVVMKIVSPQILHKSDAGGVEVGLDSEDSVKIAFRDIIQRAQNYNPDAEIKGVLVQRMAARGDETILGMNRYPIFGPLLMFGLGGIYVELFQDVVFRLAPIGRNEARRMMRNIKGFKIFKGFRGRPHSDIDTVEKSLVQLSDMVMNHPEIKELDINPLLIHAQGEGATVADCRIMLEPPIGAK